MIRRQVDAEYWLIAQDDHARISGQLAEKLGNDRFAAPSSAAAVLGIGLHDCGWPIHDDQPTLNPQHRPLDVFETPPALGLAVWTASAERAAEKDAYTGLLVSLHGLALSVFATGRSPIATGDKWNLNLPRTRFEVNRFQHRMIELQESLRKKMGMDVDRPLRHGLSENPTDPREQTLIFDYRWLAAMDQLSLAICCTEPPFPVIGPVLVHVGGASVSLKLDRPSASEVILNHWPFETDQVSVEVPFRRLPAQRFNDEDEFRAMYHQASLERFTVTVHARTISQP